MARGILITGIVFGCIAALLAYLYQDDDLDPAMANLLKLSSPAEQSEAFIYLHGIYAAVEDDPMVVGRALVEEVREAELRWADDHEAYEYQDYPRERRLTKPDAERVCPLFESACLELIGAMSEAELESLVEDNAVLLERFQRFLAFKDYRSLTRANLYEPFPAFEYLVAANRVYQLKALLALRRGEQGVIKSAYAHLDNLRRSSIEQDLLVGRLIAAMMVGESINALRIICVEAGPGACGESLSLMSPKERDFTRVMSREFAMAHATMMALEDDPAIFSEDLPTPQWLIPLLFKPHMTLNSMWPLYQNAIGISKAPLRDFADLSAKEIDPSDSSGLRNPVGDILAAVASPSYHEYVGRVFNLEAKIQLFNASLADPTMRGAQEQRSPFYHKDELAFLSEDERWICLPGPLPDERNERCLPR